MLSGIAAIVCVQFAVFCRHKTCINYYYAPYLTTWYCEYVLEILKICCGDSASFQGGFRRQRTSWILEDSILIRPTELGSTELGTPLNSEQIECEYRNQQFGRSQTYFISEITVIPSLLSWRSRSCDFCDLYRIIGTALLIWLLVGAIQQSEHKILWPVLKVTGSKLWEPY